MTDYTIVSPNQGGRNRTDFEYLKNKQFQREGALDTRMSPPINSVIIGLGGIGSHVAEVLASCRDCRNIILFDDDVIELSNLNRTAYKQEHSGLSKVLCTAAKIADINPAVNVLPLEMKFLESTVQDLLSKDKLMFGTHAPNRTGSRNEINIHDQKVHVFDCRDNDFDDHALIREFVTTLTCESYREYCLIWRPAYNGTSITLDGYPEEHFCWGDAGYTEIPSHSLPSRLVAQLIVSYASTYGRSSHTIHDLKVPFTFQSEEMMNFVAYGCALNKLLLLNHDLAVDVKKLLRAALTKSDDLNFFENIKLDTGGMF